MVVLMGKSSTNGPFSMAMLNNQMVMIRPQLALELPLKHLSHINCKSDRHMTDDQFSISTGCVIRLKQEVPSFQQELPLSSEA